jgi:hypothetical protein
MYDHFLFDVIQCIKIHAYRTKIAVNDFCIVATRYYSPKERLVHPHHNSDGRCTRLTLQSNHPLPLPLLSRFLLLIPIVSDTLPGAR